MQMVVLASMPGTEIPVLLGEAVLQSESEGALSTEQAVLLLSAILLLAGCVLLYWRARGPISDARAYIGVESFDRQSTDDGASPVAVSGTVQVREETTFAPVTGAECVAYEYKQQQLQSERKRQVSSPTSEQTNNSGKQRVTSWSASCSEIGRAHV